MKCTELENQEVFQIQIILQGSKKSDAEYSTSLFFIKTINDYFINLTILIYF